MIRFSCDPYALASSSTRASRWHHLGRRVLIAAASLLAIAAATLSLASASAFAYAPRTYQAQISLRDPEALTTDPSGRLWVSENSVGAGFSGTTVEFNSEGELLPTQFEQSFEVYSIADDFQNHDIYEADTRDGVVTVHSPSGTVLNVVGVNGGRSLQIAVDNSAGPTAGRIYLAREDVVESLNESIEPVPFENPGHRGYIEANRLTGSAAGDPFTAAAALAVGPDGDLYVADTGQVDVFAPTGEFIRDLTGAGAPGAFEPSHIAVDPTTGDLLVATGRLIDEFSPSGAYLAQINGTPSGSFRSILGIAVNSSGYLYVSDPESHAIDVFSPSVILPKVTYPGVSGAVEVSPGESAATLNATVDPDAGGKIESCGFEYVEESEYRPSAVNPFEAGHTVLCSQPLPYSGTAPADFSAEISAIATGTPYRYRLLVANPNGTTDGSPQTFELQPPTLSRTSSSDLTATTADLDVTVNPQGANTVCRFEYGTTTSYGQTVPCPSSEALPEGDIGSFGAPQAISAHIDNLEPTTYHFRAVATNEYGTTVTEDQSFNFFPSNCPNAHVRQQTGSESLPDCRAYELVSPANAGGTLLYPEGPNSGQATNPARFAFGGILGKIPGAGNSADTFGDLYVATRTDTGWVTHYVGLPGNSLGFLVNGPPSESPTQLEQAPGGQLSDLSMDKFLDWNNDGGVAGEEGGYHGSYAPYLWNSEGESLDRLPSNLGALQAGESFTGAAEPSPDFSHYFFSSEANVPFVAGALANAPGSAYDDDVEEEAITIISKLPDGQPIPSEAQNPYITFPSGGASTDGSHVLMSTQVNFCLYGCETAESFLYMRVGGGPAGVTYAIASGHAVHYVGINAAGSKVYFTSAEKLTPEAQDTSANLYMWSEKGEEEGHPLTLISKPNGASTTGTPVCPATTWTTECGAVPYPTAGSETFTPGSITSNGVGGNGHSDNSIAAENGDIYFYSPAQLDGSKGTLGQQNLYDYRGGQLHYVTTFNTGPYCPGTGPNSCSVGPMARIQVSPADTHMAFLTASKVTSYENAGFLEMYTYDPATGKLLCVSCIPDGEPPTSNVEASDNGLFMTNDGRTFFTTADPLVPRDTDGLRDVYEYVEGRPQLISSGTSSKDSGISAVSEGRLMHVAGLSGASANGTDVYFSTFDILTSEDRNGSALKFYDARTGGGFPQPAPVQPCAAADECAAAGTSPPVPASSGSGAELGALGNLAPHPRGPHHKHNRRHHAHTRTAHKRHHRSGRSNHRSAR